MTLNGKWEFYLIFYCCDLRKPLMLLSLSFPFFFPLIKRGELDYIGGFQNLFHIGILQNKPDWRGASLIAADLRWSSWDPPLGSLSEASVDPWSGEAKWRGSLKVVHWYPSGVLNCQPACHFQGGKLWVANLFSLRGKDWRIGSGHKGALLAN